MQFRHAPAGGLPEGASHHAPGGEVRAPDLKLHRYAGGLSRTGGRSTRAGRGDREESRGHELLPRPHPLPRHGGRELGRGSRDRGLEQDPHAGKCSLFRSESGGLCDDSLEGCLPLRRGREGDEAHGGGSPPGRGRGQCHPGARRRGAARPGAALPEHGQGDLSGTLFLPGDESLGDPGAKI